MQSCKEGRFLPPSWLRQFTSPADICELKKRAGVDLAGHGLNPLQLLAHGARIFDMNSLAKTQ